MPTPTMRQLIVTTALTLPMAAAGTGMAQAQANNACDQLEQFLQQDMPEGIPQTEEELTRILDEGDPEQCSVVNVEIERSMQTAQQEQQTQTQGQEQEQAQSDAQATEEERLAETERTRIQLSDEVVVEGEVFVDQQPPEVDVDSGQTEVMVQDAAPNITVGGQAPQILVREAPSTIRVDMPQPTITIEQQPPEIIVTMPPANVDVANVRPQVEVRQSEPTVTVRRTNPNVELQLSQAEDPEASEGVSVTDRDTGQRMAQGETVDVSDAQVNLTQQEPVVSYQEGEQQANVQIERGQPQVQYETAEPQVEVNQGGEPQIEITRAGEPQVTFREAGETGQAAAEGTQQQAMAEAEQAEGETQAEEMAQAEQAPQEGAGEAVELPDAEIDTAEQQQPGQTEQQQTEQQQTAQTDQQQPAQTDQDVAQVEGGQTESMRPSVQREGFEMTEANEIQVDALTGTSVYGLNDEDIGEISDLVLGSNGEVQNIIIDVGGFLGLGQKPVALDFQEVAVLREQGGDELRVYVDATEQELEQMERYTE